MNTKRTLIIIGIIIIGASAFFVAVNIARHMQPEPDAITLGMPCDFRNLESLDGTITADTNGLQCYIYDGSGVPNQYGIWIRPNFMSPPIFLDASPTDVPTFLGMTQDWKIYDDASAGYSFKYPASLSVREGDMANEVDVVGDGSLKITDYPNETFKSSDDYQTVQTFENAIYRSDYSPAYVGAMFVSVESFDLNGVTSTMVQEMGKEDRDGDEYVVTVYVPGSDSYLAITYNKSSDESVDVLPEMIVSTVRLR